MGKKRKMPGLNTSSTADISFMLLIFFLVTTSMDTDMGLARRLPNPPDPNQENAQIDVKERNVMNVRLTATGQLFCQMGGTSGDYIAINALRGLAKKFVKNETMDPHLPEIREKDINGLGKCHVTVNHVISLQCDAGTDYEAYFMVQNELVAAYNELRDELAKSKFHRLYNELPEEQKKAIRDYYPQKISEAEPKHSNVK
jgi:biopolymer transport protein ExbD